MVCLNKLRYGKACFLVVVVLLLLLTCIRYPRFGGDGCEYMLMTESLINHASPEYRVADILSLKNKFIKYDLYNKGEVYENFIASMQKQEELGFYSIKGINGKYYPFHFWLYPLLNVPALWFTGVIEKSPVLSFSMTNSLIIFLTLIFILYANNFTEKSKAFIAAFYFLCGTTYYLAWTGPEVFSASLLLIGLLLLVDRRFIFSAFLFALVAQHNPPVGFLSLIALIMASYFDLYQQRNIAKTLCLNSLKIMGVVLILLMSPIFSYQHFHVFNIIASKLGGTDTSLITLDKLFSFYFDLNQGMVVAAPWVLILLPVLIIFAGAVCIQQKKVDKRLLQAGLMVGIAIMLAVPCLTMEHWNAGQQTFIRYAYWGAIPFALAMASLIEILPCTLGHFFILLFVLGQSIVVLDHRFYGSGAYLDYKRIAHYMITHHPRYYNPIARIFVYRGQSAENIDQNAIYFYVHDKKAVKILTNEEGILMNTPIFCNQSINALKKAYPDDVTMNKGDKHWLYLNMKNPCEMPFEEGFHKIDSKGLAKK